MTNLAIAQSDQFDAGLFENLKRFDDQNQEYWLARELMTALQYKQWQKFKDVIDIAKENLETLTEKASNHFLPVEIKSQGRNALDFQLSRLACYHIALACDSRGKDAVKLAKHYFVVKTREAEVIIPQQNTRLRELELANENMRLQLEYVSKQDNRIALHGLPVALMLEGKAHAVVEVEKPTIEIIDERHNVSFKGQTLKQLAEYLSKISGIRFKTGADLKRALEKLGRGDLIAQTLRSVPSDYIPEEFILEAIQALTNGDRQQLIGE
jgi:hypothetical protein